MKLIFSVCILVLCFSLAAFAQEKKPSPTPSPTPAPSPAAGSMAGKWSIATDAGGQTVNVSWELKQTGSDFTGTMTSDVGGGTIEGGKLSAKAFTATMKADVQGQAVDFKVEGTLDGDKIKGTFTSAAFGTLTFNGTRAK